ncbi:ectoine hydroxylase [Geomicrobium halophilum]|uniref:Ectoine hydroxylase n=1 Tax=Geomicrobium halophilum TaxID=549000 RepID=A0A841PSH9_9BACL|nr:ectoine hydroxylase [Geomicrobium halophilum]MBB6450744.1 ectoine hydroxylase [Geomicrobium halophilum]
MRNDLYPSRLGNDAELIERKDPVIYNRGKMEGPLSTKDLDSYEDNGFLMLDDVFSDEEVNIMTDQLNDTLAKEKGKKSDTVVLEPESEEVRSIFEVHKNNDFFSRLASNEHLVKAAQQLLGSEVYITQSRINFKPGFSGKEFYWHSDFETWHVEDGMPKPRAVSCSIILTDNYEYNGPLMLIPGSHKWYVSCPGETPDANYEQSLQKQELGVPDAENLTKLFEKAGKQIDTATGKKGMVLFFESNTMHGSAGNISPLPRSNAFFVYNSIENQLVEPYGNAKPRPEFLANRENIKPLEPQKTFKEKAGAK